MSIYFVRQLAALCAAQSSALFSDDISRLFPPDIPASLNLHRTRLQPASGAGTGAALRKGASGANSTSSSEWSLLPASRMLPVPPASTIDTLRTQGLIGSSGGAKAAGGAVAAMSTMTVDQCNRLLQGALDQWCVRKSCALVDKNNLKIGKISQKI